VCHLLGRLQCRRKAKSAALPSQVPCSLCGHVAHILEIILPRMQARCRCWNVSPSCLRDYPAVFFCSPLTFPDIFIPIKCRSIPSKANKPTSFSAVDISYLLRYRHPTLPQQHPKTFQKHICHEYKQKQCKHCKHVLSPPSPVAPRLHTLPGWQPPVATGQHKLRTSARAPFRLRIAQPASRLLLHL
jgi:hypothetical protein